VPLHPTPSNKKSDRLALADFLFDATTGFATSLHGINSHIF